MNRFNAIIALAALLAPTSLVADDTTNNSSNGKRTSTTVRRSEGSANSKSVRKTPRTEALPQPKRRSQAPSSVSQASHLIQHGGMQQGEVIQEGEVIVDDGHVHGPASSCNGSCGGSCDGGCGGCESSIGMTPCDLGCCNTCLQPNRLCICLPAHGWAHMEYMMGWTSAMNVPPLVLQGAGNNDIFVGAPGTNVLLGQGNTTGRDTMLSDQRAGGRLRFGWWLANYPGWAIDGEYLSLGNATDTFRAQGTANNPIAIAFDEVNPSLLQNLYNANPNATSESSKIIDRVTFRAQSRLDGGAFHFRKSFCCSSSCLPSLFHCGSVPVQTRLEGFVGYRYMQLEESLQGEYAATIPSNPTTDLTATDNFGTLNQFNGADFGIQWQGRRGYWSSDLTMRMAIGNVHQRVNIQGSSLLTSTTNNTTRTVFNSTSTGILAAPSNIGSYQQDGLAVIPELGATIGYQLTQRIRLTAGYSFIYWSRVVRPGDQIDREINSLNNGLLTAPAAALNPRISPDKPQFAFRETDYWVQGLNLGGEYRW